MALLRGDGNTYIPARYVFVAVKVLNSFAYALMSNSMSLATTSMVKSTATSTGNATSAGSSNASSLTTDVCPVSSIDNARISTLTAKEGEFDWDELTQTYVNNAATYGSVLTIMIGARIADWWSPKHLLVLISILYTVVYMLTPVLARWSVYALILSRALYGLLMGPSRPATNALDAAWYPPVERQMLTGIVVAALHIGAIVSSSLSGFLIEKYGWELIFYLYGGLHLWTSVLYIFFAYDSPMDHPRISEEEKKYIITSTRKERKMSAPVPWLQILKSWPFWAHNAVIVGINWLTFIFNTELPLYLNKILHFKTSKIGYFSALPHVATWVGQLFFGFLARWIRKNGSMRQITQYKIFNALAMFGPAATLIAVTQSGCDATLIVVLLVLTTGLQSAYLAGSQLNHMDLAVNLVPTLNGISETIASVTGIVSPTVAAALINNQETLTAWSKVFYISAAFSALPYIVFFFFGSADEQVWNRPQKPAESRDKEDNEDCILGIDDTQMNASEQRNQSRAAAN